MVFERLSGKTVKTRRGWGKKREMLSSAAPMLAFLLLGIVLAAGHHAFYARLAGTDAPTGSYTIAGSAVSKERFNTAVGTAFAFLVKAALAVAVWTAYTQLFWRTVATSAKGERLDRLDTMLSVPQEFLSLFKAGVWLSHPIPFLLAVVAWLIPITAIITPATLSVQSHTTRTTAPHGVPKFDFATLNFVLPPTLRDKIGQYYYDGPSRVVDQISSAVAAQGEILNI